MDLLYLIPVAVIVTLFLITRSGRRRPAAAPANAPANAPADASPTPAAAPPVSIYAAIDPLGQTFNIVAHPAELVAHPAMTATLALLRQPEWSDQRLLDLAYGDHNGLRCAAFLAMAERGPTFTA
ncbi:hypothetical protein FJ250_05080, partial [bacterium]|nr:hypothetical protein [bacterium]